MTVRCGNTATHGKYGRTHHLTVEAVRQCYRERYRREGKMAMDEKDEFGYHNQLYQHILIFGRPGRYTVRVDNDASTEKSFADYDSALLHAVRFLGASGSDPLRTR